MQYPYPCKYSFGEDQKSWLCFILKKWESKPITTPLELKIKRSSMFVDPTNPGLRLVYFYLEPHKSSSVGRCILSLHFVSLVSKKNRKKEKRKKERVPCRVLYSSSESLVCNHCLYSLSLTSYPST